MIDVAVNQLLAERARGDSLRTLAARHGMSHEGIRRVVGRDSVRLLTDVEMALHVAHKLERMGRVDEAEWPTFVVPHQQQADWQLALHLLDYVVAELRANDVDVHIRSRPTPSGTVFQLTLGEAR